MKRTGKNQRFLENLAEVSHLIMTQPQFTHQDSVRVRDIAIDAALIFDRVETATLKRASDAANYEWMSATEDFAQIVAQNGGGNAKELTSWAKEAITSNGVVV
jgi:hypothetical protein